MRDCLGHAVGGPPRPVIPSLQELFVCLRQDRGRPGKSRLVGGRERRPDLGRNRARHLALQGEDVLERARVVTSPEVSIRGRVDEAHADAHVAS